MGWLKLRSLRRRVLAGFFRLASLLRRVPEHKRRYPRLRCFAGTGHPGYVAPPLPRIPPTCHRETNR